MSVEYQINIEYADGIQSGSLSFKFKTPELRNEVYKRIVTDFSNSKVEMDHLRDYGGVTVESYDFYNPDRSTMAPFVPNQSFKIDVLDGVLKLLEQESNQSSVRYK